MVTPTPSQLLSVWESAWSLGPVHQALGLLTACQPGATPEEIVNVPIGVRDGLLLRLRERLFGHELLILVNCPACKQPIELELTTDDLKLTPQISTEHGRWKAEINGTAVWLRLPTSADLLAIAAVSESSRRNELLTRCIAFAGDTDHPFNRDQISDFELTELINLLDDADPQANVEVPITCIECRHQWNTLFDIVSYLWTEVDAWARRLLNEIHLLASSYGWCEETILKLSPSRRQLYVNMVRA